MTDCGGGGRHKKWRTITFDFQAFDRLEGSTLTGARRSVFGALYGGSSRTFTPRAPISLWDADIPPGPVRRIKP